MKDILGKRLRKIREEKNLSQAELAENSGIAQSFVSDIERGCKSPTITTFLKLLEVLEVNPGELLTDLQKKGL